MAMNKQPVFTHTINHSNALWTSSTTANPNSDGSGTIGTDMLLLASAGAEGSYIDRIIARACSSAGAVSTTTTVLRFYVSSQVSGTTNSSNTKLIREFPMPATTAGSSTAVANGLEFKLGLPLKSGQYLLMSMHHAAAASTSWAVSAIGGDY